MVQTSLRATCEFPSKFSTLRDARSGTSTSSSAWTACTAPRWTRPCTTASLARGWQRLWRRSDGWRPRTAGRALQRRRRGGPRGRQRGRVVASLCRLATRFRLPVPLGRRLLGRGRRARAVSAPLVRCWFLSAACGLSTSRGVLCRTLALDPILGCSPLQDVSSQQWHCLLNLVPRV